MRSISLSSYLFQHLRMLLLFVVLMLTISSCSPTDVLKAVVGGGGPNVAASANVGKEIVQGAKVTTTNEAPRSEVSGPVETVDQSTTNNNVDYWLIALLIIGWLAPSPGEIARGITKLFRR